MGGRIRVSAGRLGEARSDIREADFDVLGPVRDQAPIVGNSG